SAAQVKELRVGTGTVAALQRTDVPVASVDVKAPLLEGVGAERLRASLTTAIDRLTADSIGKLRQVPRGAGGARARRARRADQGGEPARTDAAATTKDREEDFSEEDRREEERDREARRDEEQAMKMNVTAAATMQIATAKLASVVFAPQDDDAEFGTRVTPPELRGWLARLRLL